MKQRKKMIYKLFLMSYLELIEDQNEHFCASHRLEIHLLIKIKLVLTTAKT